MILRGTDEDIEDFFRPVCRSECPSRGYEPSEEAVAQMEANVLPLIQESVELLLRIAPNYVATPMRRIPNNMDAADATLSAFRDELEIRMANTQHDRVLQVIEMLDEFYASRTTIASYKMMCGLQDRTQYTLRDIDWVCAESDEHVMDSILETWDRFHRMGV